MAFRWPWEKSESAPKPIGPPVLNERQMDILESIIPGFRAQGVGVMEALIPGFNDPASLSSRISARAEENNLTNYQSVAAYGTIYTNVSNYRKDVIKEVNRIRKFYLVDVILNQIAEDSLAPDVSTGEILKVWSDNPTIDAEITKMNERYDFDDLASDITPDLVAYGDYVLKTDIPVKEGQEKPGLVDLLDTVDQEKVVAITKRGKIEKYLVENGKGQLQLEEPAEFVKFTMGNHKIRIDLRKEFSNSAEFASILEKVPKYIRIGKSLLYPILAKVKELELLEQLVPAAKLSKMSSGTLVGVNLPPGVEIEKAMAAARKIEGMINKKIGIDVTKGELTLEAIMSTAGRLKVVPLLGDKGTLQKLDYKSDEPDDLLHSVTDIRKVICTSIGVPYEIIFGGEESNKGTILKKYARYLRRLKSIQKAISEGVRQMIAIHLANKGIPFKDEDIQIEFRNKLIEIDNLDRLEFADTTISMIDKQIDFVNKMLEENSILKDAIDKKEFRRIVHEQLKTVGLGGVVTLPPEDVKPGDKPAIAKLQPTAKLPGQPAVGALPTPPPTPVTKPTSVPLTS